MHLINFENNCTLTGSDIPVDRRTSYLCEDFNAGQYLCEQSNQAYVLPYKNVKEFDAKKDWNGKSVLFVRNGGYGDLLLTTPIFKQIKKNWNCEISVSTMENRHEIFYGNPDIDELYSYPIKLSDALKHDAIICFEDLIEYSSEAKEKHVVDLFADHLGLEIENKDLVFNLTDQEKQWALEQFPKKNKRVFVQLMASSPVRTYIKMGLVVAELCRKGYTVFAVGDKRGKKIKDIITQLKPFNFVDLLNLDQPMSFRKACAVLSTCDCVVAPDSAHVHTAGALNIPCVAVYGSFDWHFRTKYYKLCHAFMGHGSCAPCFCHSRRGYELFPREQACSKTKICHVIADIDHKRIIRKVEEFI